MKYKQFNNTARIFLGVFAIAFLAFSFVPIVAYAEGGVLGVNFDPNPLFSESGFMPGDVTTGVVTVTNSSDSEQTIYVEAINGNDSDGLGNELYLVVTGVASTFYNGTLHDFLAAGPVLLGTLSSGGNVDFSFDVSYTGDDNSYQENTLDFDLCVGFSGGEYNCGDTVVSPEIPPDDGGGGGTVHGGGGGGHGGIINVLLKIDNERVISVNSPNGTALVGWETNLLATSQVIYGLASGTYTLDLNNLPYFGYPFGTEEISTKTVEHFIDILGLIPGETYKYRVVSRASPPTISPEYIFVFPGEKTPEPHAGVVVGTGGTQGGDTETPIEEIPAEKILSKVDESNANLVAALGALPARLLGFFDSFKCITFVLIILIAIYLAWIVFAKWRGYEQTLNREERASRRNMFLISGILVALVLAVLFGKLCLVIPLFVVLALLIIWSFFTPKEDEEDISPSRF